MEVKKRKKQKKEPDALAIHVYQVTSAGDLELRESIAVDDDTQKNLTTAITNMKKNRSAPLLTINYITLTATDHDALKPYIGKRIIACIATKHILKERVKLRAPAPNNMIDILDGRFFMEGDKYEALYFQWAPMLDTKFTHQMSPAIFSAKLCEGITKMAEALEASFPDSVPDFGSVRVRNAFQENQINRIGDLSGLQPFQILRMKNFGHKSIMTVFIGMLDLIKPQDLNTHSSQTNPAPATAWA